MYATGAANGTSKGNRKLRPKNEKTVKANAVAKAVPKTTKAPKAEKKSKCPTDPGSKKVTICHIEGGSFQTLTLGKKAADSHLKQHEADYCGECISEKFFRDSVLKEIPRAEGTEQQETYDEVVYSVNYLNAGIVALAASFDTIEKVTCGKGFIDIVFKNAVNNEKLFEMFPESSVLAVDGILFQVDCVVGDNGDPDEPFKNGFLIVETSQIDDTGKVVTVKGGEGSFDHLFQDQEFSYTALADTRRHLLEYKDASEDTFPKDESELKVTVKSETTVMAYTSLLRKEWHLTGEHWYNYDPYIDFAAGFGFRIDFKLGIKFVIEVTEELFDYKKDIDFIEISVPNAGFKLPGELVTVLNKILPTSVQLKPAAGLSVSIPASIKAKAEIKARLEFEVTNSLSSGEKAYEFGLKGRPPLGLVPSFKIVKDEPFKNSGPKISPPDEIQDNSQVEITLDLFGGVKPQVKFGAIGKCARISNSH